MSRAFAVDREVLLVAYDRVTPPRSSEDRMLRQALLDLARSIAFPEPGPRQLELRAAR